MKGKYLEENMVLNMKTGNRNVGRIENKKRKYSKMDERTKNNLVRSPRENGGGYDDQQNLHSRTGRDEKVKTQEKMEGGSRKRSSSVGNEKVERVCGREEKMEGHFSIGQSPQWIVVPMEEEEEIVMC